MDTRGENTQPNRKPQMEKKHPDEWERDLNPDRMKGQNVGPQGSDREARIRTAHELKGMHRAFSELSDDELRQIPVLPIGARLSQGATYADLADADRREFTATGDMLVGPKNVYVTKKDVPYELWNRLLGEPKPGEGPAVTKSVSPEEARGQYGDPGDASREHHPTNREAQDRARREGSSQGQAESPVDRMDIEAPRKRGP